MWKKIFLAVSLVVGLGLFAYIIRRQGGFGKALEAVAAIGVEGVAIFIVIAAGTLVFPGIGWWILLRSDGVRVSLWTALKANFMGFPVNFIAPSMYLGAEPLKTFYIAHVSGSPKRKVLASIIVSKFQEVGALLLTMIGACAIAIWKINFTRQQAIFLTGSMIILIVLFGAGVFAFVGDLQPTVKAINVLAAVFKKGRRKLARARTRAREMEHLIRASFTKRWKTFLTAQMVTLLSSVSLLIRPWVYFAFSKKHEFIGMEYLCAIYLVTNLVNMVPHTPGALGVMEAAMATLFALTPMGAEHATAYQICSRSADVVLILFGGWLIFHYNLQAMARRVAKGEEQVRFEAEGAADDQKSPPEA